MVDSTDDDLKIVAARVVRRPWHRRSYLIQFQIEGSKQWRRPWDDYEWDSEESARLAALALLNGDQVVAEFSKCSAGR